MSQMETENIKDGYGTVKDCATELKVSRQRIHLLINRGRLGECIKETTSKGRQWYVPKPYTIAPGLTSNGRPKAVNKKDIKTINKTSVWG